MSGHETPSLALRPIGVARTPFADKASAPRQPAAAIGARGTIELFPSAEIRDALDDLATWDRIWLIFWFHLVDGWRPKVLPPRGEEKRRGVFSTRSPHRPNPLGLSAVRLASIEDCTLHVLDIDLVDGTPIFDIKPYVSYTDAFLGDGGWLEDPKAKFEVRYDASALRQLEWLKTQEVALKERIDVQLSLGPAPHAYRRIRKRGSDLELSVKEWRVDFRVSENVVTVLRIRSGFRPREIVEKKAPPVHLSYVDAFERGQPLGGHTD